MTLFIACLLIYIAQLPSVWYCFAVGAWLLHVLFWVGGFVTSK